MAQQSRCLSTVLVHRRWPHSLDWSLHVDSSETSCGSRADSMVGPVRLTTKSLPGVLTRVWLLYEQPNWAMFEVTNLVDKEPRKTRSIIRCSTRQKASALLFARSLKDVRSLSKYFGLKDRRVQLFYRKYCSLKGSQSYL